MSAYISQTHTTHAEILIDTAWTSPTGELHAISPKFMVIGSDPGGTPLPLVIAGRGNPHAVAMWGIRLCEAARQCQTVDGVVAAFSDMVVAERAAGNQLAGISSNDQKLEQDLILVGVSETMGPVHYSVSDMAGAEYALKHIPDSCWIGGIVSAEQFAGSGLHLEDFAKGLDSAAGFRTFEIMRNNTGDIHIGGQLLHLRIDASDVQVRAVGAWPDLLGAQIDPKAKLRRTVEV